MYILRNFCVIENIMYKDLELDRGFFMNNVVYCDVKVDILFYSPVENTCLTTSSH